MMDFSTRDIEELVHWSYWSLAQFLVDIIITHVGFLKIVRDVDWNKFLFNFLSFHYGNWFVYLQ